MKKKGGPNTEEGKEIVRLNSTKHGLTSDCLIALKSFNESFSEYETVAKSLKDSVKPRNYLEKVLVEKMAKALFKTRRFEYLEAKSFCDNSNQFAFMDGGMKGPWLDVNDYHFELMLRYQTSLENQFQKSFQSLMELRQPQQLSMFEEQKEEKDEPFT